MPTLQSKPRKPSTQLPRSRKYDHGAALELALQGWTNRQIAHKFGVAESSIAQAMGKYAHLLNELQPGSLEAYQAKRSQLFTAVERELMASLLDPSAMAKASLNNRAYAFQQIHTARRLEEGKSTENHAVLSKIMGSAVKSIGKSVSSPKHSSQVVDSNPAEIMPTE